MNPEAIFVVDESVSYEWCSYVVYRHPVYPDKYATFADSGCSCSYAEEPTEEQLRAAEPMDRASVRMELKNFLTRYSCYINAGDAINYMEDFQHTFGEAAA